MSSTKSARDKGPVSEISGKLIYMHIYVNKKCIVIFYKKK